MAPAAPTLPRLIRPDRRRACAALGVALCIGPARAGSTVLRVTGTGSALGGVRLLAAAYREPGLQIEVLSAIGSPGAIRALIARRIDLALSNRLPNEAERALAPLSASAYARTPLAICVAARTGVTALTSDQLAALYRPGATFPNGRRARPVLRLADAADLVVMRSISPAVAQAIDAASRQRGMMVAATDSDAAERLLSSPGAFGGCTMAMIESEKLPLVPLVLDGRVPTVDEYAAGRYPFGKSLVAVLHADAPAPVVRFAAFLRSPEARELLRAHGHLPV